MTNTEIILELKSSLQYLVDVKMYKDIHGKDEYYLKNQPLAWEKAKNVLTKININSLEMNILEAEYNIKERCEESIKEHGTPEAALEYLQHELNDIENMWSKYSSDSLGYGITCSGLMITWIDKNYIKLPKRKIYDFKTSKLLGNKYHEILKDVTCNCGSYDIVLKPNERSDGSYKDLVACERCDNNLGIITWNDEFKKY